MNPEETMKFKKQYEALADSQLIQMLVEGSDAYVEGAYELLQAEAGRRGIEIQATEIKDDQPQEQSFKESLSDVNDYVQLVIINHESDKALVEPLFNKTDITYFFQNLNIRGDIDLPVGLMVDQSKVEEAIALLKDFKFSGSIVLW